MRVGMSRSRERRHRSTDDLFRAGAACRVQLAVPKLAVYIHCASPVVEYIASAPAVPIFVDSVSRESCAGTSGPSELFDIQWSTLANGVEHVCAMRVAVAYSVPPPFVVTASACVNENAAPAPTVSYASRQQRVLRACRSTFGR